MGSIMAGPRYLRYRDEHKNRSPMLIKTIQTRDCAHQPSLAPGWSIVPVTVYRDTPPLKVIKYLVAIYCPEHRWLWRKLGAEDNAAKRHAANYHLIQLRLGQLLITIFVTFAKAFVKCPALQADSPIIEFQF
jgi:hypothetical protein